ncbi:uncharacterized protein LOC113788732 [Dermatophagoides pteronyssinus]|uniref:uncharacterized protein LOC113788732 n=1 Tax=Dermatophagoides pteronyssinus TaxID=6956 RepID=UPI003F66B68D
MTNFRKVGERLLPHEVNHIRINPSMDIVALALSNSDIAINRLFSWQRVWSISKPKIPSNDSGEIIKIIDMVWSIDGKILAVAYNRPIDCENRSKKNSDLDSQTATKPEYVSSIVLYLIESNQRVCVHNLEYQINCLCWQVKSYCPDSESSTTMKAINIDDIKLPLDSINIPYVDLCICDEELLNYPFNVTTSGKSSVKSTGGGTYQSETNRNKKFSSNLPPLTRLNRQDEFVSYDRMNLLQNKSINILTVGTEQNSILFYLFGYYQILNIDLKQFKIQNDNQRLNRIWISPDLNSIQVYFKNDHQDNQDNGGDGKCQSQLMLFETKLLGNLWKEIFLVNRIRLNIDLRMDNLRDKINEICSIWSDVIADIKSRLSNYQLVFENSAEPSPSSLTDEDESNRIELKLKDFIDMLIFGNISLNLERFLNDLNRKETSKLYHSFEQCLDDIYRLIITNLLNTLTQILSYLDNLRGMALNDFLFGDLGISIDNVNEFRREILWMMDKCNQLMTTLDNLKCKMLAITRLIYKGIFMSQYSMEQQNEFEYSKYCDDHLLDIGRMTLQDFHLIMDFFNDNSFENGFEFHQIESILDSSNQESSSTTKTNDQKSKNIVDNDENIRNPYKSYLEEKHLKNFLQILNQGKNFEEMSFDDLLQLFSGILPTNDLMKFTDNLPSDDLETKKWFEMLINDTSNIDLFSENIPKNWSLLNHFERLNQIKQKLFNDSFDRMSKLQSKFIEKSNDKMMFDFHCPNFTEELYEIQPTSLDCHNVLNFHHHTSLNNDQKQQQQFDGYLYVCKFNDSIEAKRMENSLSPPSSTISIFRFHQPIHRDNHFDLLQFNLIGNCYQKEDCNCNGKKKIQFHIEDCQFYNSDWATMIITECHTEQLQSIDNSDERIDNRKQYLLQCRYSKMFDSFGDCIEKINNNNNNETRKTIKNHSWKIDLGSIMDRIWIDEPNRQQSIQIDGTDFVVNSADNGDGDETSETTIDSFFKLRLLNDNVMMINNNKNYQQKSLSVSGNRNLACCCDTNGYRITTFEMDINEDDDDDGDGDDNQDQDQQQQQQQQCSNQIENQSIEMSN